ncbi:MFS transporter [Nesterenkonia ebinurensis]|uniref:MFS transporter n=1 Tax=Nesterenkonia ebinurensis TaxID=2608252 RepID=UPI00123D7499|nr:MFS transporter [Nesterenkonia ebinurensis]
MSSPETQPNPTVGDNDDAAASAPKASTRQWLGLAILVIPLFMLSTDITVLYLAMPAIAADLAPAGSQPLWILHIGEFLSAATMITFGLLAQRIGARRLLLSAVAAYGLASLIATYAVNPEMLIGGRALLGVAAAAFTPAGMILVRRTFRNPKQYNVAFASYMAAFAGGMAAGPPLGGLILEHFWWGAVFLINVPVAAILLIGGPFLLERNHSDRGVRIDAPSVVLSIAAVLALVYGLQEIATGNLTALSLLSAAIGIGLLLLFLRRQRTTSAPLLDLALFRNKTLRLMLILIFIGAFGMAIADMLLPQFLQITRGLSPLQTGLVLLGPAIGGTAGTMLTPLFARARRKGLALAGVMATTGAGGAVIILMLPGASLVSIIIALTIISVVSAPFMTLASQMLITAAPEEKTGSATAVQDVTSSLGMASSLAFLGGGVLTLYRRILSDRADAQLPEEAVDAAGESFGASAAVAEGLDGVQGSQLIEAADAAFTIATQTGYGAFAGISLAIAVVLVLVRRHIKLG